MKTEHAPEDYAATCELLAQSFSYPNGQLAEAITSGIWSETVAEIAIVLNIPCPNALHAFAEKYLGADTGDIARAIRIEATRLFIGAPDPAVWPFEGMWRSTAQADQPLLFINPYSLAVENFMNSCGAGQAHDKNEPLDHIVAELEFLQYLSLLEARRIERLSPADFTQDDWSEKRTLFLNEHFRTWVPDFARKVVDESREPFFIASAQLLKSFSAL